MFPFSFSFLSLLVENYVIISTDRCVSLRNYFRGSRRYRESNANQLERRAGIIRLADIPLGESAFRRQMVLRLPKGCDVTGDARATRY